MFSGALALACAVFVATGPASAQQSPGAAAQQPKKPAAVRQANPQAAQQSKISPQAFALNEEGLKLANSGQYQAAIEKLEAARELEPANATLRTNLYMIINAAAVKASNAKDNRTAEELYDKAASREDAPYNIYMNYGTFLLNLGRVDEAAHNLDKALNMTGIKRSDESNIRLSLGAVYMKKGMYDEAVTVLEPAAHNDKNAEAYFLIGKTQYSQGRFEQAIDALGEAVKCGKNGPAAKAAEELLKKVKKEGRVESKFENQSLHHFQVQFDGERRNDVKVDKAMQLLEEAYNGVGSYFNYYPEAPTAVIIYSQNQFKEASDSPVWVAALYDGKIRLPLNDVVQNSDNLKQLIFHEYTHAVIFHVAQGRCPVWLNEGFAQILEGNSVSDRQTAVLKKYLEKKQLFDMKSLEGSFMGLSPAAAELAYAQALSFTNFAIEKIGQSQMIEALQLLGQGKSMSEIFTESMYTDYKKLQADWMEQVAK